MQKQEHIALCAADVHNVSEINKDVAAAVFWANLFEFYEGLT